MENNMVVKVKEGYTEEELKQKEITTLRLFRDMLNDIPGDRHLELWLTANKKSIYDGKLVDEISGDKYYLEYKWRNEKYADWMIEVKKYDNLLKYGKVVYICQFHNDIYFYRLDKIPVEELILERKYCPETTKFNKIEYVLKDVYILPSAYKVQLTKWNGK